jgi:hypothetical protein
VGPVPAEGGFVVEAGYVEGVQHGGESGRMRAGPSNCSSRRRVALQGAGHCDYDWLE